MDTISHFFQSQSIEQASDDTIIRGIQIPLGYVNATEMCKAAGKTLNGYTKTEAWKAYLDEYSRETNIFVSQLIIIVDGYGQDGHQGTWMHLDLALWIAQRISPKFAVWANKSLRAVINGDFQALTHEAEYVKRQLKETWQQLRDAGKDTRRSLTDAIKSYIDSHEVSPNYKKWVYANVSDSVNLAVFGSKARPIVDDRQCDRNKLRDTHEAKQLRKIEKIEDHATVLIDRGIDPIDAVSEAINFYTR